MTTGAESGLLVHARKLRKNYQSHQAVRGVDLTVRRGEAVGLLGPNGAGKTSLMRMLACVSAPSGGELSVLGLDPRTAGRRIRGRLGVVPQHDSLDTELSPRQNIYAYGRYFCLPRQHVRTKTSELLEFARLTNRADCAVDTLSGGMRRRLTIARALVNSPELLLLDEPTTGLDPQARQIVWQQLRLLKKRGVGLIVTSHHMDEVEELCDRVLVLDLGKVVAEGTPAALITRHAAPEVVEVQQFGGSWEEMKDSMAGLASHVEVLPERVLLYVDDGEKALARLRDCGVDPHSSQLRRGSLEDVFLRLTGRSVIG